MRMTTTNTTNRSHSGDRQNQIAPTQTYRELPSSSQYDHVLRKMNELAGNFAELLVAAQILSSFQLQNYWFSTGEMQI